MSKVLVKESDHPMDQYDEDALRDFIKMGRNCAETVGKLRKAGIADNKLTLYHYENTLCIEAQTVDVLVHILEQCVNRLVVLDVEVTP